jgi:small GTP-binding protein
METKIENLSLDTNKENSYQFIFKIILIGDANCGKTSLINRFVTKSFNDKYICTIGVDFMTKAVKINNQTIKLQIWDTAGMEKYKQITTSYYRGAQAAIVCFDLTSNASFTSLQRWVDDYSKFYNPIFTKNIFIVGNKSDLVEDREVSREEIDRWVSTNNYRYYETSAKSGNNVELLFFELANVLFNCYKGNINNQINDSVRMKRSTLNSSERVQDIMLDNIQKKKKCC